MARIPITIPTLKPKLKGMDTPRFAFVNAVLSDIPYTNKGVNQWCLFLNHPHSGLNQKDDPTILKIAKELYKTFREATKDFIESNVETDGCIRAVLKKSDDLKFIQLRFELRSGYTPIVSYGVEFYDEAECAKFWVHFMPLLCYMCALHRQKLLQQKSGGPSSVTFARSCLIMQRTVGGFCVLNDKELAEKYPWYTLPVGAPDFTWVGNKCFND